jgi:sarcosine oxidase, subunit gamma
LQQALEAGLVGIHSQVVDNSGGFTWVTLQGANVIDLLHHCTVYDAESLAVDHVVGTTFGKMTTLLLRNNDGYHLVLRRSFADYIWRLLERSAEPYGFGVAAAR